MSKQPKAAQDQSELAGCIGAFLSLPVIMFLAFQIFFSSGGQTSSHDPSSLYSYTPPTPKEQAERSCSRAVERKYSAYRGFDIIRLTAQQFTMIEQEDETWSGQIAVPFKTVDAQTGRRDRLFWINVKCEIAKFGSPKITETDTAGYPG